MGGVISFARFRQHAPKKPSREVRIRTGLIRGFVVEIDSQQREVEIFLGIPFAKPPIGELRFKKPEPPSDWEDTLQCIRFGHRAPQADFFWERWSLGVGKSEDCLKLNVFAPLWTPPNNEDGFAVMVFVHGGGYLIDSAVKYGDIGIAKYLCRHDVVVVSIQYRLGLLGFFSTGDENCPGSMGLWDQTLALQWVQEIHEELRCLAKALAGRQSICCQSAHTAEVIPMAGNGECEWATVGRNRVVDTCRRFAKSKGFISGSYNSKANSDMLKWLRGRPSKEFERSLIGKKGVDMSKMGLDLAPIIGHDASDFLPKSVADLRAEAPRKNIMTGTCEQEGLLFAVVSPNNFDEKSFDRLLSVCIPDDQYANAKDLRDQAKELYYADVDAHDKLAVSDAFVKSIDGQVLAASHCTELAYLFGHGIVFSFKFNETDKKMLDLTTRMFTNFVKYGNPNGPFEDSTIFDFLWEPASEKNNFAHLQINEKCTMVEEYHGNRFEFWKNLGSKNVSSV